MLLNKVYRRIWSQMEVPRGTQHWGLKFHADCEVMSRTANAKDSNTAQRPRASSYPCLQQHFPPKKLSLLQTQSLCHVSPGMPQWLVLRLLGFTPTALKVQAIYTARGMQCKLSIYKLSSSLRFRWSHLPVCRTPGLSPCYPRAVSDGQADAAQS